MLLTFWLEQEGFKAYELPNLSFALLEIIILLKCTKEDVILFICWVIACLEVLGNSLWKTN